MKYKLFNIQKRTIFTEMFYRFFPLIGSKKQKYKSVYPFQYLTDNDIKNYTNIDPIYTYRNQKKFKKIIFIKFYFST